MLLKVLDGLVLELKPMKEIFPRCFLPPFSTQNLDIIDQGSGLRRGLDNVMRPRIAARKEKKTQLQVAEGGQ